MQHTVKPKYAIGTKFYFDDDSVHIGEIVDCRISKKEGLQYSIFCEKHGFIRCKEEDLDRKMKLDKNKEKNLVIVNKKEWFAGWPYYLREAFLKEACNQCRVIDREYKVGDEFGPLTIYKKVNYKIECASTKLVFISKENNNECKYLLVSTMKDTGNDSSFWVTNEQLDEAIKNSIKCHFKYTCNH